MALRSASNEPDCSLLRQRGLRLVVTHFRRGYNQPHGLRSRQSCMPHYDEFINNPAFSEQEGQTWPGEVPGEREGRTDSLLPLTNIMYLLPIHEKPLHARHFVFQKSLVFISQHLKHNYAYISLFTAS